MKNIGLILRNLIGRKEGRDSENWLLQSNNRSESRLLRENKTQRTVPRISFLVKRKLKPQFSTSHVVTQISHWSVIK